MASTGQPDVLGEGPITGDAAQDVVMNSNVPEPEEDEVKEPPSLLEQIRRPRALVSFVIAIVLIYLVAHGFKLSIKDTWAALKTANLFWFLAAFAVYYFSFII